MLSKILIPAVGSHASRRFINRLTESESDRIQHLIDGYRLDAHGFSVNPIPVEHPPLPVESVESGTYDPIPLIARYMIDGLDSADIRRIQKMIEDPKVESELTQSLEKINGFEFSAQTPSDAWEMQDLSDNGVPTLVSIISNQHGIFNTEKFATLRALLDGSYGHEPDCVEMVGIVVECDNFSSYVGTNIDQIARVFELNRIPVETMFLSDNSLQELDALLLTGKSVCLVVDGRPLWAPLFDHISEAGLPVLNVIQIVRKESDGDYIALDTTHELGREIVYTKAQILEAWETTEFRTFVTKNPVPGWKGNTEDTPTIEPTQNEVSDADTANPSVFDTLIASIEAAASEGEEVGEDMASIQAAMLTHTHTEDEALTMIFEPGEHHTVPDVHITPEINPDDAEVEAVDFSVV